MPPQRFFRSHGSIDSADSSPTGREFWRLVKYFRRKSSFLVATLFAIFAGCCPVAIQSQMSVMLTAVSSPDFNPDALHDVVTSLIIVAVVHNVITPASFATRSYASPAFMSDIRRSLYTTLMSRDISYFDVTPTGILISRLSQDVALLFQVYIDKSLTAIQSFTQGLAGIVMALIAMWQVALPAVGVVLVCCAVYGATEKVLDRLWAQYNENSSFATSKAEEVITSFRTIKSFDNELREANNYRKSLDSVNRVFRSTSLAQGAKDGAIWVLIYAMIAALLYFGSWLVVEQQYRGYTPGDIMMVMISIIFASNGASQALALSDDFKKASVSAAKVLAILETPAKVDQAQGEATLDVRGRIEFIDVGFRYDTREEWAVRHLTFTVEAGETVALIGESGCGKSTTLQLLQRFYEIGEGRIVVDGVDIATLAPRFLRSRIAVVPQGPVLFSMSVIDNIRFAKRNATEEEVATAANVGNAHEFIMELPHGYETQVHQTSLSGGQKQRICISRAILANAPILLLDEATAALDTESEQLVQQSLEVFRHGKTAILVAHRLATVRNADRIIVFKEGHVEETGTHDELIERNGLYSELVRFQLQ